MPSESQVSALHAELLVEAFAREVGGVLGKNVNGTLAFVRCLVPGVVEALATSPFAAGLKARGWIVYRVADRADAATHTITADKAVEIREAKKQATLLLVDTERAGAGMDGIYSAAQEVDEATLFDKARELALKRLSGNKSKGVRHFAEQAMQKARGRSRAIAISRWAEFDFLVRSIASEQEGGHPADLLYLLGLWPVARPEGWDVKKSLRESLYFVQKLIGKASPGRAPQMRILDIRLREGEGEARTELLRFLQDVDRRSLLEGLALLADKRALWVNTLPLPPEESKQEIESIELVPWRKNDKTLQKWSGLTEQEGSSADASLLLPTEGAGGSAEGKAAAGTGKLEVRWKPVPSNLKKGAVRYRVSVQTAIHNEEIAGREIVHKEKVPQSCVFTGSDFEELSEETNVLAHVVVSVVDAPEVEAKTTEEFTIRFGEVVGQQSERGGKRVRTLSEGVIELRSADLSPDSRILPRDGKGYLTLRTEERGKKNFRVYQPPLMHAVEQSWAAEKGAIGRWRVRVRETGERMGEVEFVSMAELLLQTDGTCLPAAEQAEKATRQLANQFAESSGVAQIYSGGKAPGVASKYITAWEALLREGPPELALAGTVEVCSLSGESLGLIVLPMHPLRVAWHAAYDSLLLHARFEEGTESTKMKPEAFLKEFRFLDGAMFPAFLPGIGGSGEESVGGSVPFLFADSLGFHAVCMVRADDREPKAAVAMMARALGNDAADSAAPTVGSRSAGIIGSEIAKYLECHEAVSRLHVHAMRPGDGSTVARALGHVHRERAATNTADDEAGIAEGEERKPPAELTYVLELYPSQKQRGTAGRFIADALQRRRSGSGVLDQRDRWMVDSLRLPGDITIPRLRWARKRGETPDTHAHLAIAFDTFESELDFQESTGKLRPALAFGLLSFFEREFHMKPVPEWRSLVTSPSESVAHPKETKWTKDLGKLHTTLMRCVTRQQTGNGDAPLPILLTRISSEGDRILSELHSRCDWVISIDRNVGIEYFDSPRDNLTVYETYVIDCVPEREDMGSLQLITSTSNMMEVRRLLDDALRQMGLSQSRRNAAFLLENLKALSGRLAMRLASNRAPTNAELIALALSHKQCQESRDGSCWAPLASGALIPVDDVRDLLHLGDKSAQTEDDQAMGSSRTRPDLIYFTAEQRKPLSFRFIEVKYRRTLASARDPELLSRIREQLQALRTRWDEDYSSENIPPTLRALRKARLARVLRFYADKARRHNLGEDKYNDIIAGIDSMVQKADEYSFGKAAGRDTGWVFCPEYRGKEPMLLSPDNWDERIYLFGPHALPDSGLPVALSITTENPQSAPGNGHIEPTGVTGTTDDALAPFPANGTADGTANGKIVLGTDLFSQEKISWETTVRGNPHMLIAGLPGMGKTTALLNLTRQMLDVGIHPIIFSYHDDIDEKLGRLAPSLRLIKADALGFNPLQVTRRESGKEFLDVAGSVRDIFRAIFPDLGEVQGNQIRDALMESFLEQGWNPRDVPSAELVEPPFRHFYEILRTRPATDKASQTLLGRLRELADYGLFDDAPAARDLWQGSGPTVIQIHTTTNEVMQRAFASLIFYSLYKEMFRRGQPGRITHAIIFDEAHRAARLKLIPTMAKECRKYGILLILASQQATDFDGSLFSAIANYLILRLNQNDAKALMRNVSVGDQERNLTDKVKQLERYHAIYFSDTRRKPAHLHLQDLPEGG